MKKRKKLKKNDLFVLNSDTDLIPINLKNVKEFFKNNFVKKGNIGIILNQTSENFFYVFLNKKYGLIYKKYMDPLDK